MARIFFIIAVFFLVPLPLFGQAGKDLDFWSCSWSQESEIHKSVVFLKCNLDQNSYTAGSGCLIDCRRVITAAHVVDGSCGINVRFFDGTVIKAKASSFDTKNDFAILELEADAPNSCVIAKISNKEISAGDEVEICGFAGDAGLRHFKAKVLGSDDSRIVISGYVAQGDSGGPIFNQDGEVVSVVSGGSVWLKNRTVTGKAGGARVTTPIIGPVAKNQSR